MHHDIQIKTNGKCTCRCHEGASICACQLTLTIRIRFNPPIKTKQPGRTKLTSRVKPWGKQRGNVMRVVYQHGFHELRRGEDHQSPYDKPL